MSSAWKHIELETCLGRMQKLLCKQTRIKLSTIPCNYGTLENKKYLDVVTYYICILQYTYVYVNKIVYIT